MTDYVIHLGPVTFVPASGAPPGGGVVGSGNQWDDGSDGTYATVKAVRTAGGRHFDDARAFTTTGLPADVDTATVTAITATIRVQTSNAAALANRQIRAQVNGIGAAFGATYPTADWVVPNNDGVHDLTAGIDEGALAIFGRDLAYAANYLKTAFRTFSFQRSDTGVGNGIDLSATLFEAWITVTYGEDAEPPPAIRRPVPPLRQRPRSDGLASSSALRVWPASRSIQGSNRQGPGAYL